MITALVRGREARSQLPASALVLGLDQMRHFSGHKQVATMMLGRDERTQAQTQAQIAGIVGDSLRSKTLIARE